MGTTTKDIYYTSIAEFKRTQRLNTLSADSPDRIAVEKLSDYVDEYYEQHGQEPSEWQKKSGRVVLAVLVCRNPDSGCQEYLSFTGMNFELSQTTGSRCAEQNAIGAAASCFVPLKNMRSIAVVDPLGPKNPLAPCGVCAEMLRKIQRESPDFRLIEFPDFENERFDLIRSWFPGRLTTAYAPDTTPKELQIWTCSFCGFGENTPHASCCLNCKQETRSLLTLGKSLEYMQRVLRALLDLTVSCPHTHTEYVHIGIAHEIVVECALMQTGLWRGAMKNSARIAIKSLCESQSTSVLAHREKRDRQWLDRSQLIKDLSTDPTRLSELVLHCDQQVQQCIRQQLRFQLTGFAKILARHGLGGCFEIVRVGAPDQEREEFAFTKLGRRYVSNL